MLTRDPHAYRCLGAPKLEFGKATNTTKLRFTASATCVLCSAGMTVSYGEPIVSFKVGYELLGLICDNCLSTESRNELRQRRAAAQEGR